MYVLFIMYSVLYVLLTSLDNTVVLASKVIHKSQNFYINLIFGVTEYVPIDVSLQPVTVKNVIKCLIWNISTNWRFPKFQIIFILH